MGKRFKELLGSDITFFNKLQGPAQERENALEHDDECKCNVCKIANLKTLGRSKENMK
tara:strand:- start:874 stop:1047 length:174 start_codon:yes stop_codon:yes gene_type:complete